MFWDYLFLWDKFDNSISFYSINSSDDLPENVFSSSSSSELSLEWFYLIKSSFWSAHPGLSPVVKKKYIAIACKIR